MAAPLKLVIEMSDDGVATGLKVVSKNVEGSAQEMRRSLGAIGSGAKEASPHLEGFTDKFRGFVAEERQQNRMSGFLATQISQMGFASKSAAGEVTQLLSAFAFGGGLGVIFESAKMLVEAWHESGEAAKKATEEAVKSINELHEKVKDYIASLKNETEAEKLRRKDLKPLQDQEAAQKAEMANLQDKLGIATSKFYEAQKAGSAAAMLVFGGEIDKLNEKIRLQQNSLVISQTQIGAAKGDIGSTSKAEAEKARLDAIAATAKSIDAQIEEYERGLRAYVEIQDKKTAEDQKLREQGTQDLIRSIDANIEEYERELKALEAIQDKKVADNKHKMKEMAAQAQEIGNAFGSIFAQMAGGTISAGKMFAEMAKIIIQNIVMMAIIQIKANAGIAGAEAAASQAMIPFGGPWMAIAALSMVEGAVLGLLSLVSAADGFDVPSGVNPITQLHAREMVLPAEQADVIRGLADGGGDAGGVHLHVHSVYADSDGIRRMLNDPRFAYEFREAARRGRLR